MRTAWAEPRSSGPKIVLFAVRRTRSCSGARVVCDWGVQQKLGIKEYLVLGDLSSQNFFNIIEIELHSRICLLRLEILL